MAWAVVYFLHIYCFPQYCFFDSGNQNQLSTALVLHQLSWSYQSVHWEDCLAVFTYNMFFSYSSLYMCNYFYIAFPEVSGSIQIPEMLFCLQQMLWEVYGISEESVSLVTFSKFACQRGAVHHQRHCSLVHGERASEVNNLCSLAFCFEYTDEGKTVVDVCIAGDRHAEKLSWDREDFGNETKSFIRLGKVSVVVGAVPTFVSRAAYEWPWWDRQMILLRMCIPATLSGYLHFDGEGQDSAAACSHSIPLKKRYKGDFFSQCVKTMDQEPANLTTEAKLVKANQ